MENRFYVYALLDPRKNNQPFYIGKGSGRRAYEHLKTSKWETNVLKVRTINAIRAKGLEPIVQILMDNLDEETALLEENKLILLYGRRRIDEGGTLTNRVASGTGGRGHSPEARAKMSATRKGKPVPFTEDGLRRMKEAVSKRERSPEEIAANTARCKENGAKLKGKPWPEARRKAYEQRFGGK